LKVSSPQKWPSLMVYIYTYTCACKYIILNILVDSLFWMAKSLLYPQVFFLIPHLPISHPIHTILPCLDIIIFLLPSCRVTWMAYLDDRYDRWFTVFEHGDFP
jgi:hypothetical protein